MKKLFSVLLAAAMTVSAMSVNAFAEETPSRDVLLSDEERAQFQAIPVCAKGDDVSAYEPGDVNMDGTVDVKDVNLICYEVTSYTLVEAGHMLDEKQLILADLDGVAMGRSGDQISVGDAMFVLHYCNALQIGAVNSMKEFQDQYLEAWKNGTFQGGAGK